MNYIFSAIFLYFFLGFLLYIFQRRIVFNKSGHPGAPKDYNLDNTEEVYIKTEDNLKLLSWYHKGNNSLPLIVYFHGNSFHIGDRAYRIQRYIEKNWSVLLVSWRGFGGNEGNPTEKNLYKDSEAVLKWIKNNTEFKFKELVIYGESLGTAVAVDLASRYKFSGIILESPFTSMLELAQKYYPIFPIKVILKDRYESKKKLNYIKSPVLVMHGRKDNIVPFYMGQQIYEALSVPKFAYFNDQDDHMMEYNKELISSVKKFLEQIN